ncbi:MAG: arylsulfatase A-like enzyme [Verrucomicrobiales bacterium]|jgi:arylsulfatase A-like enzyme
MHRVTFHVFCFIAGVLAAAGAPESKTSERPNIVFIMVDDLGYGDLGCFGQTKIKTPNIDLLAEQGMRFTSCYAGSPVCAPSRSVLMTGQHSGHTRVRGNTGNGGVAGLGGRPGRVPLEADDVTVAEGLQSAGYTTGMVGKWGLGEPGTSGLPNDQGFDFWFGFLNQRRAHSHYPEYLWLNRQRFELPGNSGGRKQQYAHDQMTGFALHFIRERAAEVAEETRRPFFLYVPYTVPHSDFEVPDFGIYADKSWSENARAYAAMITRMDGDVGRMMGLLEEMEMADNTVVFFCSDNGAADRYDGLFDSSGVLRGRKRDLFEGGIRTPMIVRWPQKIAAGAVNDMPWTFADFLPTAWELANVSAPESLSIDGKSIVPTLCGSVQPEFADRFFYWEFFEKGYQQAARWRNWKAVRLRRSAPLLIFDLATDPSETADVAAQNEDVVARFEAYLKTARTESSAWPIQIDR